METRTQIKYSILYLNDMRSRKYEQVKAAAISVDSDKLDNFIEEEKSPEVWKDGQWSKSFKQGSPLEWFNQPSPPLHGISSIWLAEEQVDELK